MRVFLQILFFILSSPIFLAFASEPQQSIIIEVEGDPHERKEYIETYHPTVDVVATYDLLFNGLALQAKPKQLSAIHQLPFIEAIHPVSVYKASPTFENIDEKSTFIPNTLNTTGYLGKGVKVGVIDTGIDYDHPDLAVNFKGGYDLVDLDEDPQETTEEEGPATLHGTHVAGIIAANGAFQGVAPEAEIYAYRALGPGGVGTSIQVIAAMEQALLDDVDVLNLSLGNSINGPDYPTSEAVNQATEKGVAVVIANGNDGPNEWTVGSPATASKALSVGAAYLGHPYPFLVDRFEGRTIPLTPIPGSVPWKEHRSFNIVQADQKDESLVGKIALIKRNEDPLEDQVKKVEDQGAVAAFIYREEDEESLERIYDEHSISIPVIVLSKEDGSWLQAKTDKKPYLANIIYETIHDHIAPFSSRGPVTQDWTIKPDLVAPGTNILSTVPGGYQTLQGTSMAAPHVAGSIAVLKEARPNWTNEQIFGALKTTALLLQDETGKFFPPNEQGTGLLQLDQALHTETIIDNPNLSFGQLSSYKEEKTIDLTIENLSDEPKTYTFSIPKKEKGYLWHLPQSFTIQGKSQKTISIELNIMTSMLKEGLHQGYLELHQEDETYHLPYAFINKTAQYPKAMGFNVMLKPFTDDEYVYQLYVTDPSESIQIDLFDPDTLRYDRPLLHLKDLEVGLLEGALPASTFQEKGHYKALITIKLKDRRTTYVETDLFIE